MKPFEELFEIAKILETSAEAGAAADVSAPLANLARAADEVKLSSSGSGLAIIHGSTMQTSFQPQREQILVKNGD